MRRLACGLAVLGMSLAASAFGADASGLREELAKQYLDGKWEELEANLASHAAEINALPAEQKAEVTYIRQAVADGRPGWWKQVKEGKKVLFRPTVWGRQLAVTYDPECKSGVQIAYTSGRTILTVNLPVTEMDDPGHAEHGFTKGELSHLMVWMTLGQAECWSTIGHENMMKLDKAGQLNLQRYLEFRGSLTGAYYAAPRSRRWAFWLDTAAWMPKYAASQTIFSRKAVGAMFVAEVVGHPEKYPSIRLPDPLPAEDTEEKVALHLKGWIEKHPWTVAEDKALREAMRVFATANNLKVYESAKVTLPNGLQIALDAGEDKELRPKRDAWLRSPTTQPASRPAPRPATTPSKGSGPRGAN